MFWPEGYYDFRWRGRMYRLAAQLRVEDAPHDGGVDDGYDEVPPFQAQGILSNLWRDQARCHGLAERVVGWCSGEWAFGVESFTPQQSFELLCEALQSGCGSVVLLQSRRKPPGLPVTLNLPETLELEALVAPETFFLEYTIVDERGQGYPRVSHTLTPPGDDGQPAALDAAGFFRRDGVRRGAWGLKTVSAELEEDLDTQTLGAQVCRAGGDPLAFAAFVLTPDGGDAIEGTTDAFGRVHASWVGGPDCTIVFPEDAARHLVALDGVALQGDEPASLGQAISLSAAPDLLLEVGGFPATLIELHDTLFRTESAVMMPGGAAPSQDDEDGEPGGVGVIASCLRFAEEHADKRALVAGHADTSGKSEFNQPLSEERADCVHACLVGDRQAFVGLAVARHQVGDYKQILAFVAQALGMDCDPGAIDDNKGSGVRPVKAFQRGYNGQRAAVNPDGPELGVDGDVGPMSWGAMFDCYEAALRDELGEDSEGLAGLREKLVFVDPQSPAIGFGEHHPVDALGLDDMRSEDNRRVEVLFFDPGEEPDLLTARIAPEHSELYRPGVYTAEKATPLDPAARSRRLQTDFALEVFKHAAGDLSEEGFVHWMHLLFGSTITTAAARALHADLPDLPHPPALIVQDGLSGHLGAYDRARGCILIDQSLLDPIEAGEEEGVRLATVLLEEFGHHVDQLLRTKYSSVGGDAKGDEGRRLAVSLFLVQWQDEPRAEVARVEGKAISVDWAALKGGVGVEDLSGGPDAQAGDLEFHSEPELAPRNPIKVEIGDNSAILTEYEPTALYPSYAAYLTDSREARAIQRYFALLPSMHIHGLVEMAAKLALRLEGEPSGLFMDDFGELDVLARVTVLQNLRRIYDLLNKRFLEAPLGPDGLPEFTQAGLGDKTSEDTELFLPGSPLEGLVEDIVPFGSIDSWVLELNTTRLPPVPKKPDDDDDDDWPFPDDEGDGEDGGGIPPEPDPDDVIVDDGHPDEVKDDIEGTKLPDFDARNRTTTIVDALWGGAGELIGGTVLEVTGPLGAAAISLWGVYNTVSEIDARRRQDGMSFGYRVAVAATDLAANQPELMESASKIDVSLMQRYIARLNPGTRRLYDSRYKPPGGKAGGEAVDQAVEAFTKGLSRAVSITDYRAKLQPGYNELPEKAKDGYLKKVRARVYQEYAASVRAVLLSQLKGLEK